MHIYMQLADLLTNLSKKEEKELDIYPGNTFSIAFCQDISGWMEIYNNDQVFLN